MNKKKQMRWTAAAVVLLFAMLLLRMAGLTPVKMEQETTEVSVVLYPDAQKLYENRNPYVGDAVADGRLMKAIREVTGSFTEEAYWELFETMTTELQTTDEPYVYMEHFVPKEQDRETWRETEDRLDADFWARAVLFLALVENCGEVRWDYIFDDEVITYYVTREDAEKNLGVDAIGDYGTSPQKVQELLDMLEKLTGIQMSSERNGMPVCKPVELKIGGSR